MIATGNKLPEPGLMEMVIRLKGCCERREEDIRTRSGLSLSEYGCLRVMLPAEELGAGALARRMGLSPSRGSRIIDKLVRRGLLLRRVDADDRRAAVLTLSAKGRNLKQSVESCLSECEGVLRERLTPAQHDQARRALTMLIEELEHA